MSKTRWPLDYARLTATVLSQVLTPFCERVAIAGSIRRGKEAVGDIELLYVPRYEDRQLDLISTAPVSLADEQIDIWLMNATLAKRPSKTGVFSWGEKNKLAVHVPSGIPTDLFATSIENWFVALVIRTGCKETNLRLTTGAQKRGGSLEAYGCGVRWSDGTVKPCLSERDVFEQCGVPYLEPNARTF